MKWGARSTGRSRYLCLLAVLAVFGLGQDEARADEVHIAGYTNGCFNCAAPPNTSATQGDTLLGLTYTNSTFTGTTAAGFRGLGGNPVPPGVQGFNNLGSFTLASSLASYDGNSFTLRVTFTAPQGIAGSNTAVFTGCSSDAASSLISLSGCRNAFCSSGMDTPLRPPRPECF